jgi:hypothetical protein
MTARRPSKPAADRPRSARGYDPGAPHTSQGSRRAKHRADGAQIVRKVFWLPDHPTAVPFPALGQWVSRTPGSALTSFA